MSAAKRIVHVVTNVSKYENKPEENIPTGLWAGELSHAWDVFAEKGYQQTIVSPKGGKVPIEPKSLQFPASDASAKSWTEQQDKVALLENTKSVTDVDAKDIDALYLTGGHAVMFDFDDANLQKLIMDVWKNGGIVSSVCHGYCGLLDVKDDAGKYLIADKKLTGFSWNEEVMALVSKHVPYNAEERAKERGGKYEKALVPFVSNVVVDGKLVTGQNPASAKATAEKIVELLSV
ncbi:hypothetical protein OIV83_001925 [Microbotryomycetes sp. JL201]|nr:hypothetical protein OIV83_001925 [Microbotryomycetes sp. JL201]